jgi:hypothetical protein
VVVKTELAGFVPDRVGGVERRRIGLTSQVIFCTLISWYPTKMLRKRNLEVTNVSLTSGSYVQWNHRALSYEKERIFAFFYFFYFFLLLMLGIKPTFSFYNSRSST